MTNVTKTNSRHIEYVRNEDTTREMMMVAVESSRTSMDRLKSPEERERFEIAITKYIKSLVN